MDHNEKISINKSEIKQNLINFLNQRNEIIFALIHGSFIKDIDFNDIDIAVFINGTDSPLQYEIALETDIILADLLPCEPDIRVLNHSPLYFQYNILKVGVLLFNKDENIFFDFKERIIRDYLDFQPHYKQYLKEVSNFEI